MTDKPQIRFKPKGKLKGKVSRAGQIKRGKASASGKGKLPKIVAMAQQEAERIIEEAPKKEPKGPGGRPTKYDPRFITVVRKMGELGATRMEMAEAIGVDYATLNRWCNSKPEFCEAVKVGAAAADARVEAALYRKAVGFEYDSEKVFCHEGLIVRAKTREVVHPDNASAIFWLKNRKPDQWRDRQENVNLNVTMEVAFDQFIRELQFKGKQQEIEAQILDLTPTKEAAE